MAYSQPDADALQARFPAFADVADATVDAALERARRQVDSTWLEDDRAEAEMLLAAHELTLDGLGTGADAKANANGAAGFKVMKSADLTLERFDTQSGGDLLSTTLYGQRFKALRRRSHPGIKAV